MILIFEKGETYAVVCRGNDVGICRIVSAESRTVKVGKFGGATTTEDSFVEKIYIFLSIHYYDVVCSYVDVFMWSLSESVTGERAREKWG